MKRWLGASLLLVFALTITAPFFVFPIAQFSRQQGPGQQAAPERGEPTVALLRTATGQHVRLPMEEYVTGVVAGEMGDSFPDEALAAQAILARTYSLRVMQVGETLTDDPAHFQTYRPDKITDKVRAAVTRTRGAVITYQGQLVDAVYHSCSGGRTASASEGMQAPDKGYLRPVADPPCPHDETWSARFPATEVAAAAGVLGPVRQVGIGQKGPSGRALTLVVNGKPISVFRMWSVLGGGGMLSTYLTDLRVVDGKVQMSGRGFGHGVGMSQWGAAVLANKGFTADDIVHHYFSDVDIELYW